ncbi:unnamed protein product [Phytophthora lilii]|uniref:Unnamed protein product n=1 Tax=Phytophthora lilii TaxID=2077276 RepID=A0A9W6UBB5_9STRA|nr:unnamed protein product [Phytophthora lilii]
MAVTKKLIKFVPHDASPQLIVGAIVTCFVGLVFLGIFLVYQHLGERVATVVTVIAGVLALRWVYLNGVGVLGWTGRWLHNSDAVIGSLASKQKQTGTLRVICISDTHAKHRNTKNIPDGDVLLHTVVILRTEHWTKIPSDVDVLMTHGPPHGILDLTFTALHVGSEALLHEAVFRIRPRFHVFGHIHEAYGATRIDETVFINSSTTTLLSKPSHAPV